MSTCSECGKGVSRQDVTAKVQCSDCSRWFHSKCVNLQDRDVEFLTSHSQTWRCKSCHDKRRSSIQGEELSTAVVPSVGDIYKLLLTLTEDMATLKKTTSDIEKQLGTSIDNCHERLNEHREISDKQQAIIERQQVIIDNLLSENKRLVKTISDLTIRCDDSEQYSRINTLEIYGVPEMPNENVTKTVIDVARALDVEIKEEMIDACHRLPKVNNRPTSGIIVKFVRRCHKEQLLERRKVKRNLSTTQLGFTVSNPVYVNQSLAPARRVLFAKAKQIQRDKDYKYLWVNKSGKILIRKGDGTLVHTINCVDDLSKL